MRLLKYLLLILLVSNIYAINIKDTIKLYNQKQYKKSYKAFLELLEKDNYKSNALNYYFAKSAEHIGNYKEALGAIERILINEPNDELAQYERAKLYFLLKNYSVSKQYFQEIASQTTNQEIQKNIKIYLTTIEKLEKKDFLSFSLIAKLGYDSNINNTTKYSNWNLYFNNLNINVNNNQEIKQSNTLEEILVSDYKHKFENSLFDNKFLIYSKQYTSSHIKDFTYFKESPSISYKYKNFLFNTRFNFGYLIYANNHYLSTYGIEEIISKKLSSTLTNKLDLKIDNKIYAMDSNQNATFYSITNNIIKHINNKTLSALVGFDKNKAHSTNLATINYSTYKAGIASKLKYSKYNILAGLKYEYTKYKDKYEIFNKYQKDKKTTFYISANKEFKRFALQANYKYIINDSNIAPFDYNKWIFNISFIKNIKGL